MAWFVAVVAAVAVVLPSGGPAVAQVTVPGPDFNNDGFGDLAVGVPGEDIGAVADAGALNVLYGLDGVGTELLTQADAAGTVEAGDAFRAALSDPFFHQGVSGLGGVAESTDVFAAALS